MSDVLPRAIWLRQSRGNTPSTTDLKPNNVLLRSGDIDRIIAQEMVRRPPVINTINGTPAPPGAIPYKSQPLPPLGRDVKSEKDFDGCDAVLVDFGHGTCRSVVRTVDRKRISQTNICCLHCLTRAAQRIDDHIDEENIQSTCFRAPEVVLGHPWSTAADIWSFACTVSLVRIGGLPIGLHYRLTYPSSGVQDIRDCNRRRTLRGLDGRAAPRDRGMLGRR